jgi:hypothetical protein
MGLQGLEALLEALIALPDRLPTRRAVPRAGEEATQRGQAPPQLAQRGRGLRRVAVRRPGINGVPRPRVNQHCTGPSRRGATSHGATGAAPGDHERARHGVQPPLSRLHASWRDGASVLAPSTKAFHLPPPPLPRSHRRGTPAIHPRETREPAPCKRLFAVGRAGLFDSDGHALDRGQPASQPAGALNRHPLARAAAGGPPRRSRGLTRQPARETAPRPPLRHGRPPRTRRWRVAEPPLARRSADDLRPVPRPTPPRRQQPRVNSAFPSRHGHDERLRTAPLDRARPLIPCPPAGTLLLRAWLALARLAHWRRGTRPPLGAHYAESAAGGRTGAARMAPIRRAVLDLHRPRPRLRRRGAVMQTRGLGHEQDHRLRPAPCERRVVVARQHRLRAHGRVVQNPLRGHGLRPAVPGTRKTGHGVLAESRSQRRLPRRGPSLVKLTRTQRCRSPIAQRFPPLRGHCASIGSARGPRHPVSQMGILVSAER